MTWNSFWQQEVLLLSQAKGRKKECKCHLKLVPSVSDQAMSHGRDWPPLKALILLTWDLEDPGMNEECPSLLKQIWLNQSSIPGDERCRKRILIFLTPGDLKSLIWTNLNLLFLGNLWNHPPFYCDTCSGHSPTLSAQSEILMEPKTLRIIEPSHELCCANGELSLWRTVRRSWQEGMCFKSLLGDVPPAVPAPVACPCSSVFWDEITMNVLENT